MSYWTESALGRPSWSPRHRQVCLTRADEIDPPHRHCCYSSRIFYSFQKFNQLSYTRRRTFCLAPLCSQRRWHNCSAWNNYSSNSHLTILRSRPHDYWINKFGCVAGINANNQPTLPPYSLLSHHCYT